MIDKCSNKFIFSEAAFKAMDRNKDGYITKGELKLAKKKMSMKEVDETIKDYDLDNDGKLNYEEFLKSHQKWNKHFLAFEHSLLLMN